MAVGDEKKEANSTNTGTNNGGGGALTTPQLTPQQQAAADEAAKQKALEDEKRAKEHAEVEMARKREERIDSKKKVIAEAMSSAQAGFSQEALHELIDTFMELNSILAKDPDTNANLLKLLKSNKGDAEFAALFRVDSGAIVLVRAMKKLLDHDDFFTLTRNICIVGTSQGTNVTKYNAKGKAYFTIFGEMMEAVLGAPPEAIKKKGPGIWIQACISCHKKVHADICLSIGKACGLPEVYENEDEFRTGLMGVSYNQTNSKEGAKKDYIKAVNNITPMWQGREKDLKLEDEQHLLNAKYIIHAKSKGNDFDERNKKVNDEVDAIEAAKVAAATDNKTLSKATKQKAQAPVPKKVAPEVADNKNDNEEEV